MLETIPVNFHCHSMFSDGDQTPEALAAHLAAAGVRYAALTDHDSLEGFPRFQEALKKRGVACLPGVEITTQFRGREAHLLGYGFDPQDPELAATLFSLRQIRDVGVHSIAGSLRRIGTNHPVNGEDGPSASAAPHGRLEIGDAIALIHRAGGRAFWAHPLLYEADLAQLGGCVAELKGKGLDGLEAIYASFSDEQRADLRRLAQEHDLLVSAGTDFHAVHGVGSPTYVIDMPRHDWVPLRAALFNGPTFAADTPDLEQPASEDRPAPPNPPAKPHHFQRRSYGLRILLPASIATLLFLAAIWGVILPSFEQSLLERKRELIRELTNSTWSILASYERDEQNGLLTRQEAQSLAIAQVEALRYGPEGLDYFWIQDMQPRMIMHPYRSDLNGQDLASFTDPRGVAIFVEFADLVRREGEGYIDYVWQWKDDPSRLEPKESYVRGFAPWGWVIGTGIYIDDVHTEIRRIERNLVNTSLAISGAVVLLILFVLQQSLRIEHERQEALETLSESTERYHTLIEATTEGTLLILDSRCRYANPTFLSMTGYTERQLEFLDPADLLPREAENQPLWDQLAQPTGEPAADGGAFEGVLQHADGRLMECVLALNSIVFAAQHGFILIVRDLARQSALLADVPVMRAAQGVPVGVFRARAARRASLLEMNAAARAFFHETQPALADLFSDDAEFESLLHTLQNDGAVDSHLIHVETSDASARFLSLSARLVRDEAGHTPYIDGVVDDVTAARRQQAGREALIERLQTSLLFLHEPIRSLGRDLLTCDMHAPIEQLARQMTARNVTAALVMSQGTTAIGIVTDHDLRARVLAKDVSRHTPIHTIMSAPLAKISENALIYEALLRMEERGVRHLAVEDRDGQIVSVVEAKALVQFQRYGPIVLSREISRAADLDEIVHSTERTSPLVKALMDSSARPRHVTNMLASICDAATERLVQLAIEELGPPPADFA
ncbi:MAG: cache domain-containing protein, partial [Caldilineaceae bacterium]|nr:cache domain-containing protein [Caldilineaceae bacterium]